MNTDTGWTGGQYSLYRVLLGLFLLAHFSMLLPYAGEVFVAGGVLASAQLSPMFGVLPNPLAWSDAPIAVQGLLTLAAAASVLLMLGWGDRAAALICLLVLAWLFGRNPLIANPSLPLLGWMLVAHLCAPPRPYGSLAARRNGGAEPDWRLPMSIYASAFVVLAVSYSYSGYTKLLSPGWVSGVAIREVLQNPLARDHALNALVLALPPVWLKLLTWFVLVVELLFAPLACWRRARPWLWLTMLIAQFGFLIFLDFADLTLPMLLAHLLTFDPRWVERYAYAGSPPALLLFDGHCGFCHGLVRLAAMEDPYARLRFASLDGPHGGVISAIERSTLGDTIVLIDAEGRRHMRAAAVAEILKRMGGLWTLLGIALAELPQRLSNAGYDLAGRVRYRLTARYEEDACPLLPAGVGRRRAGLGPAIGMQCVQGRVSDPPSLAR